MTKREAKLVKDRWPVSRLIQSKTNRQAWAAEFQGKKFWGFHPAMAEANRRYILGREQRRQGRRHHQCSYA
jgi:hypothetical protein